MKELLRDPRIRRLLLANITGSIGAGVTIIAIPWILIQREGGERLYGYITILSTLALFAMVPHYGAWLDRHSRKAAMLAAEIFGAVTTLSMASLMFVTGEAATWQLLVIFFCGMLYYTLHFPAKFAFVQQVFERRHYQSLMGLLEIQGQTASMLAGGLAALMIDHVDLSTILLLNGGTYVFSYLIQRPLPYTASHVSADKPKTSTTADLVEGLRWLGSRPAFTTFILCTLAPFVAVMVGNYLFPIYVQHILRASATVFGTGEMAFAAGSIAAGLVGPLLLRRLPTANVALAMMAIFVVGLVLLSGVPTVVTFYVALLMLGLGNAGARVARGTVMLHEVPNALMGRVNVVIAAIDRLIRTLMQFAAIAVVVRADAVLAFGGLLTFTGGALLLAFLTRRAIPRTIYATVAPP